MKILLVTESYWPNADGGALFERRLALGLVSLGDEVTVWAPGTGFSSYIEQDGPYIIHRERAVTFWANTKYKVSFWPFWSARRIIRETRPDVIHIHNVYLMGLSALYWAKRYRIPVVATNHFMPENALMNLGWLKPLYGPLHKLVWWFLVKTHNRARFVTSPTPTAVSLLIEHGLKSPAEAISNGIDLETFKPGLDIDEVVSKYGVSRDQPVILYVGRLDGEKRTDLLIRAFAVVLKRRPAQLVLAGFGKSMNSLKALARELDVDKSVIFTGYLPEELKPNIYDAATVFVIASPAELQSIVTLEAMASALPIVAVDVAALKELCHDGQNGYLFPRDDSRALAAKIEAIIANRDLAAKFGQESLTIVKNHHSTAITFQKYAAVYLRAIGKEAI